MSKHHIFFFISLIGIFFFAGTKTQTAFACANPPALPGFALPCPVLDVSPLTVATSGSITVTATPSLKQSIYQTFYLWNGSVWIAKTFSGNFSGGFASTTVTATIPSSVLTTLPAGTNYIAEWDWSTSPTLRCFVGASSSVCNTGSWRVQTFTLNGGGGGGTGPCGPPIYCAYTGVDIVQLPTPIPALGTLIKNNALVYDTSFVAHGEPVANLSPISRCTDINTTPGADPSISYAAGIGGSGAGILWNTNSTLLHIEPSIGGQRILLFNPTTMQCSTAITQDKNLTTPGSATKAVGFGGGYFSLSNPDLWYSFSTSQVIPYDINPSTGFFTVGSPIADFTYGMPIGANAPAWQSNHSYKFGDIVSYTLTQAQAPDWAPNANYAIGDIIVPQTNNPAGCAYKKFQAGVTGATQPKWSSICNLNGVTDNVTGMWRNLGGPATFTYQLTSGNGTSGSNMPAFVPANGHPDLMTTVSDNGLTWTNIGPDMQGSAIGWDSSGGVSRDGTKASEAVSLNSYGYAGNYNLYNADQDTGIGVVAYDSVTNTYHYYNTGTGIATDYACNVSGGGYNCAGGKFVARTLGQIAATCRSFVHNLKTNDDGMYAIIAKKTIISGTCQSAESVWRPQESPFNPATTIQFLPYSLNHWAPGKTTYVTNGLGGFTGYNNGSFMMKGSLANPQDTTQIFATWKLNPSPGTSPTCDPNWVVGSSQPPCSISLFDSHVSWAYNPNDADNTPVCFSNYGYTSQTTRNPISSPWANEEMCASTNTTDPAQQKQWRFTHTFNTQTNSAFDTQFSISELSQDGQFMAWTTDMGPDPSGSGSFGSTSGGATCKGGFPWQSSYTYPLNYMIRPIASLSGSGAIYNVFQAISVTGPTGINPPAWGNFTQGQTVVDGGITWQDIGAGDCRGDVLIVKLR